MELKKAEFIRLFSLMGPRVYLYLISSMVLCVLLDSLSLAVAWAAKDIIAAAQTMQVYQIQRVVGWLSLALAGVLLLFPVFRRIFAGCVKQTMFEIRLKVFNHMAKMPVPDYERNHSGDFISRLTNDIQVVEDAFYRVLNTALATVITGIITATAMFILNWMVAVILIVTGMAFIFVNAKFSRMLREYSNRIQKQKGKLVEEVIDILAGLPVIRVFQLEPLFIKKYGARNDENAYLNIQRTDRVGMMLGVNYFLSVINSTGIFAVGTVLVVNQMTDFGTLTAMVALQMGIDSMILQIGPVIADLQRALAGASRLWEILDGPVEDDADGSGRTPVDAAASDFPMVEISGVKFQYDQDQSTLDILALTAETGKITAVVGPSGSGKSTVFKLLLGFYPPDAGQIRIAGQPGTIYSRERLREMMAYVPQDAYLFSGTIAENIAYGKYGANMEEISAAARVANAHDFIMEMPDGYQSDIGEAGNKLSGGQKQRIAIARAILKNAPILLLDEATSALDAQSEQLIQNTLDSFVKGRTVLVVAHRLSTIQHADRIYVMDSGRVVESGKHAELIGSKGLYNALYEKQFRREI
jgi:ATP-binding cassette subfamily B protein